MKKIEIFVLYMKHEMYYRRTILGRLISNIRIRLHSIVILQQ